MPHVNGGGGEDLASSDEVKVYNTEGEAEGSEHLTEDKSDLVTESEEVRAATLVAGPSPDFGHQPRPSSNSSSQTPSAHGLSFVFPQDKALSQSFSSTSPKNAPIRTEPSPVVGKPAEVALDRPLGYVVTPYPYPNGTGPIPISMANKVGMVPPTHPASPLSFVMYNESFGQPPPAHMGIPPVHIDPKTGKGVALPSYYKPKGMPRPPMYPLASPGQYPHPMFASEFAQWHPPSMYPMTTATGYRGPYSTSLVTTAGLPRFTPGGLLPGHPGLSPHHPGIPHPAIVTPGPKQEIGASSLAQENHLSYYFLPPLGSTNGMLYNPSYHGNQLPSNPSTPSPDLVYQLSLDLRNLKNAQQSQESRHGMGDSKSLSSNSNDSKGNETNSSNQEASKSKGKPMAHIKKPLNAFMLYMKEMRAKVVAECTLKESAAINQILGRRWHALGRDEQAKYYELARKERQLHMQLYPGWTARDNYAQQGKKKKRKRDKSADGEGSNPKKCRARFGLDQQSNWCKPCRRKKKCIRYVDGSDSASVDIDDNLGSVGSSADIGTPDSKSLMDSDQDHHTSSEISLSSPPVPENPDSKVGLCLSSVGNNPHDGNNPLSVSSLTGQCNFSNIKRDPDSVEGTSLSSSTVKSANAADAVTASIPAIVSVT